MKNLIEIGHYWENAKKNLSTFKSRTPLDVATQPTFPSHGIQRRYEIYRKIKPNFK